MTPIAPEPRPLRSVAAVLAGFVAPFVLSVATDGAMHANGIFPVDGSMMSRGLFGLALAYRTVFTVAGGYLTARIAPHRPMRHAAVLAGLGFVAGLIGLVATWGRGLGPEWYPIALVVLAIPSVLLGARLAGSRVERSG